MAVTDLTGTKWRWNDELYYNEGGTILTQIDYQSYAYDATAWMDEESRDTFEIVSNGVNAGHLNFTSNNENFVGLLSMDYTSLGSGNSIQVYELAPLVPEEESNWSNEAYRIFEVTGGTDATNTDLIAFIQLNATQIIEETVLPSFSDAEVTPHEGYITMTINGVEFNLKTAASN